MATPVEISTLLPWLVAAGIVLLLLVILLQLALILRRPPDLAVRLQETENAVRLDLSQTRQESAQMLHNLAASTEARLEAVRTMVDQQLHTLLNASRESLEAVRLTVDERLQTTLERRLGESFAQVGQRLEQVHLGLGEMRNLARGVGDLTRLLGNVKSRGTWGEVQLGAILAEMLAPGQYEANVAPGETDERVEFAIRLPGQAPGGDAPVWLPIDAKFPKEDYERLTAARESADAPAAAKALKQLENALRTNARSIRDKYIRPPQTTDFAIMFLPVEGLYAEALQRPGLAAALQREFRVTVAGPTTLAALLNSLQTGFRTLAIEQRTSEAWTVLAEVKGEFQRFGDVLAKVRERLEAAGRELDQGEVRARAITRRLRAIEEPRHGDSAPL